MLSSSSSSSSSSRTCRGAILSLLRARCLLLLPLLPVSLHKPLTIHGDLLDSTLSLARYALSEAHPETSAPRPKSSLGVTNTHPLVVSYNQCLGAKENPCVFASLYLEDLRNGQAEQLDTIQQLTDALPKTEDPTPLFSLSGHIACHDQPRLQHSMRFALWWMLPSD